MSCDFDIHCLDCGKDCGFSDLNWGGDHLASAMKYRALLETLLPVFTDQENWWMNDDGGRFSQIALFLCRHVGHDVVVKSEYGQIYSRNGCPEGNTGDGFCDLSKDHEGPHHYPPKLVWDNIAERYRR